jgi:hypothetical protein
VSRTGVVEDWKREFKPYLRGAAEQFAPGRDSLTERWLNGEPLIRKSPGDPEA